MTSSVGKAKVDSAADSVRAINPETRLTLINERLAGDSLARAIAGADIVIDGTDNFAVRYAINDACFAAGKPLVSGAAIRMEGQVAVFDPRVPDSPCYRCLYPSGDDVALNCSENGVAAPLVGIIGTVQAMEAWKLITGCRHAADRPRALPRCAIDGVAQTALTPQSGLPDSSLSQCFSRRAVRCSINGALTSSTHVPARRDRPVG